MFFKFLLILFKNYPFKEVNFIFQKIDILQQTAYFFAIIFSLPLHEFAHAYFAYVFGDDTAKKAGRLTINPLKHLDILGCLSLIFFGFGWARPVPVNSRNLKNPVSDMALISMAGPASNLLLAIVGLFLCKFLVFLNLIRFEGLIFIKLIILLKYFVLVNLNLAVFNLIPIPPLDASKLFTCFLINKFYHQVLFLEQFGSILILFLVYSSGFRQILGLAIYKLYVITDFLTSIGGIF